MMQRRSGVTTVRGTFARVAAAVMLVVALSGCQGGGATEVLRIAEFEERQNNPAHARELYQQLLADYPNSPEAARAKERLAALDAAESPHP